MIKGIYIALDSMGVPRYVGMSFNDLMQRQRHVNGRRSHNKKLNEFVKANGPLRMEFHDLSRWSDRDIRIQEARLIRVYGREDLGTGTLLNGNDGEFGPYNYDPVLRSEAARKAAKTRRRSKGARLANETRGPEGRSLAAKAAAWTRAHDQSSREPLPKG